MSQEETERLDFALQQAQADLEKAERLLIADPMSLLKYRSSCFDLK